jgi:hypothetical protein
VLEGTGKILSREVGYSDMSPQEYVAALRRLRK